MKKIIFLLILIIYSINVFPQYLDYKLTNQSETLSFNNNELYLPEMTDKSTFYKSEIALMLALIGYHYLMFIRVNEMTY